MPVQENLVTLGEALERAGLEASAESRDTERQLTLLPGDEERIQLEEVLASSSWMPESLGERLNGPKNLNVTSRV